jgi:hypothetical protein
VHIPKFRNDAGKILANASTPDFSGASDKILGYALKLYIPSCQLAFANPTNPNPIETQGRSASFCRKQ